MTFYDVIREVMIEELLEIEESIHFNISQQNLDYIKGE